MVDLVVGVATIAATFAAVLVAFVVVPEVLERRGHDPKGAYVRAWVWGTFLALVLVPAALSGYLFTVTNPAEWFLLGIALVVAIAWEYYRLHPKTFP